ncbi:DUF2490 domain-containing protein [uncultured Polaribacter sp.]|uniref:DUF2490 domain-containing protein n=1 Tax=uncultured Polaribacter sp. TaxID=174711 RepID=UPI0030DD4E10|tara:strand:+ start:3518 stop:4231 length:714 start_codon:yes stop_codon:yes gene_type:complete
MKINKTSPIFIKLMLLNVVLFTNLNYAQTEGDTDWASWNTIGVEYKLNKKWSFGLEEQFRLKENFSETDEFFTQLSADYELFNNFKLGAGIRYIRENDNVGKVQGYENHFRFQLDASYKHDINDFTIGYRLRYQNKNELGVSYDEGDYVNQNVRFKTSVDYNIKNWRLDPKFSAEIFNQFQEGEENGFNKYRLTFGTDYKIKNIGEIGVYYRFEKELNVDVPDTKNILGLSFIYKIK